MLYSKVSQTGVRKPLEIRHGYTGVRDHITECVKHIHYEVCPLSEIIATILAAIIVRDS